ncbi:MAG: class I SAM-dependent methyltransferase [Candidatus Omnitrophota bacterium]
MPTFRRYARFYDTIYRDKNYDRECDFLEKVFKKASSRPVKTILSLGCGTASHECVLAKRGYKVTGVDISSHMLDIARKKAKESGLDVGLKKGNIQTVRLNKKFDAVISMFDVLGYQITEEGLKNAVLTARHHLKKGGLFIFDFWHGLGVLNNEPKNRRKISYGAGGEKIVRHSKCKTDKVDQIVEVSFSTKQYIKGRLVARDKECHRMRFFFVKEINLLLSLSGFEVKDVLSFPSGNKDISEKDWKLAAIAAKA